MLGSMRESSDWPQPAGLAALYVVTDNVAGLFERATAAGAEVLQPYEEEDYGGGGFSSETPRATSGASATTPGRTPRRPDRTRAWFGAPTAPAVRLAGHDQHCQPARAARHAR